MVTGTDVLLPLQRQQIVYMHRNLLKPRNAVLPPCATILPHFKVSVLPFIDIYPTRLAGGTLEEGWKPPTLGLQENWKKESDIV